MAVVALIVVGIVLVLLEANRSNDLVRWLLDAGKFLTTPFHDVFKPHGHKANVGVNWGLAAVVYAIAGSFVARLLRR
jgi:drug/metabolite transporter (DMT)-like permease